MDSLNIIIPTYNRIYNLSNLIKQFTDKKWKTLFKFSEKINIYILNDFEEKLPIDLYQEDINKINQIGFEVIIKNNKKNRGHGINFATHMRTILKNHPGFFITIGDDDLLIVDEFLIFLKDFYQSKAQIGIAGFLQDGKNHNLIKEKKIIRDKEKAINKYANFGKGTGIIMRLPTESDQTKVENTFLGCMFEDKVYGCLNLRRNPKLFVYPKVVAKHAGSENFLIPYSFRVYLNLDLIRFVFKSEKRLEKFLKNKNNIDLIFQIKQKIKLIKMLLIALKNNIFTTKVRYTSIEILYGDLLYFIKHIFVINSYPWQTTYYLRKTKNRNH